MYQSTMTNAMPFKTFLIKKFRSKYHPEEPLFCSKTKDLLALKI